MKYKPEVIFSLYRSWRSFFDHNNKRGFDSEKFVAGHQWNKELKDYRESKNKSCLVFNECLRLLKMVSSEISSFDYGLKIKENTIKNPKKIQMAQKIFEHMILSDSYKESFVQGIVSSLRFGYSVSFLTIDYENDYTLQITPRVTFLDNPEFAFFDKKAVKPFKEDGAYCGLKKKVSAFHLKKKYKKDFENYNDDDKIEIIDFWYKSVEKFLFYETYNGSYKRKDKIRNADNLTGNTRERNIEVIYFKRVTENKVLEQPKRYLSDYDNYVTNKLPLIFFGKTFRYPDKSGNMKEDTSPFVYNLIDAQCVYNTVCSEISDLIEAQNKRQYFATPSQISDNPNDWARINEISGTVLVNDPGSTNASVTGGQNETSYPQVVDPPRFNIEMLNVMNLLRSTIVDLAGVNVSQQGASEDKSVSGAAVEARINQGSMLHIELVKYFNKGINYIGQIIKNMFPYVIKNEYTIIENGEELVTLNKKLNDLSEKFDENIINTVEELNEDYDFTIEAMPISRIERNKALDALMSIALNKPQLDPYLMDIIFKNLSLQDSSVLQRRFQVMVPSEIYEVGSGAINRKQYEEYMAKKQEESMQAQQAQAQNQIDPMMADVKMREEHGKMKMELDSKKMQLDYQTEMIKLREESNKNNIKFQQERINQEKAFIKQESDKKEREFKQQIELAKLKMEKEIESQKLKLMQEKLELEKQKIALSAIND